MFQITPRALNHVAMDRGGVAVPAERTRAADAQKVAPLAVQGIEHQGPEPDLRSLGHPDTFIVGDGVGDDLVRR